MSAMVSYSRRPQSGQSVHVVLCLNRTYHVLLTLRADSTRQIPPGRFHLTQIASGSIIVQARRWGFSFLDASLPLRSNNR